MLLLSNLFTLLAGLALYQLTSARPSSSHSLESQPVSHTSHISDPLPLLPRTECDLDIANPYCGHGSATCFTGPNTISQSDLASAIESACYGNLSAHSTAGQWLNYTQPLKQGPSLSVLLVALNIGPQDAEIVPEHCVRWFSDLESDGRYCAATDGSSTQGGILRLSFPTGTDSKTYLAMVLAIQGNDNDVSTLPGQNGCPTDWGNPQWVAVEEALQQLSAWDSLIFPMETRICH